MAEYAKKTVAELQEILKSRGLPSSGKKAELIARLNENDKAALAAQEAPVEEPEPSVTAAPAQSIDPTPAQSAPPIQAQTTDPTSAVEPAAAEQPSPDTTLANQASYSLNLPTSTLDSELAKRKARAERFGTGATTAASNDNETSTAEASTAEATTSDAEALRNLERAKRFGTGQTAIGKLDEALPTEIARGSRKRGHAAVTEGQELDDPGLKRSFANRGRGRGGRFRGGQRGGRQEGAATGSKPQGVQKGVPPAYTSEKDRLAAEARKKKFATA